MAGLFGLFLFFFFFVRRCFVSVFVCVFVCVFRGLIGGNQSNVGAKDVKVR